ncbi:dihydrolipoyllysine-residue acetyltransferase component of pyruvate dehydrogenase complex [Deinococcus xinjiangensis]|uniref:Dihydrolipoamide acetyltransferase component of pyruvate dehydrogenase complex n=1 Tax=Deinococcus xinjiangensis TaxID=457454 RepID=A0ABP9VKS1_9DEIO
MSIELKLPDVGDNIEKGTVVTVNIKTGDSVQEGQPIIELETDKAVVEVPASASGIVENVNVKVGDSIQIGGVIATLGETAGGGGNEENLVDSSDVAPSEKTADAVAEAQEKQQEAQAASSQQPAASGGTAQVTLPDVGDNIEKGNIVTILVNVGDQVSEGQPVVELETDKAVVEVPSNASGTVQSVDVKVGDSVKVGGVLLTLSGAASGQQPAASSAPAQGGGDKAATIESSPTAPNPDTANKVAQGQQDAQKAQTSAPASAPAAASPAVKPAQSFDGRSLVPAAPSVRRLAREMHIDIHNVQGTGIAGRISEEDVRRSAGTPTVAASGQQPAASTAPAVQAAPLPDFTKWGNVTREDMSGIRKATIRSMTTSWTTIPMVTQFDKADVTVMEETRKRFGERVEKAGGKLTMTHILMKVVANALHKFPKFNASLDLAAEQIILKDYVNIGVAVDTPVGLLVPVVKDADKKSITELVLNLTELAGRARERKLKPDEMQGATFTISNLGGIGGHAFTPIVNSPEVAILGVSRGGMEPVWDKEKGEFVPRNMLPLSLTYDHRLIDGADAARFLRFICESLEDPFLISL